MVNPPAPQPLPARFGSPRGFVQAIAARLAEGEVDAVVRCFGDEVLPAEKATFFQMVFAEAKLKPQKEAPLREIGDVGERYRWAIGLSDPAVPAPTLPSAATPPGVRPARLEIEIDVARDPAAGWKAVAVHFPGPLRAHVAARLGATRVPEGVAGAADEENDPLKIAQRFLGSRAGAGLFARAQRDRHRTGDARESGGFVHSFRGGRVSAGRAAAIERDRHWRRVGVGHRQGGIRCGLGIRFRTRIAEIAIGRVACLRGELFEMLAGYMQSAGIAGGVAYAPIVRNPAGGESLVVYFDFNQAGLVPRAQRQLEIVAKLLRDDTTRKLRLSGFADAIGSDEYNRRLSAARAHAARDALISLGVSPDQIVTEGFGKLQPLDANTKPDGSDNPEGRSRNRRTEIFLDF